MSVTSIEENAELQQTLFTSCEDNEFDRVYKDVIGRKATKTSARLLFDAGVDFIRSAEIIDSLVDKNGSPQLLTVNPLIIPPWMFRDAMLCYTECIHEELTVKHSNGVINTQRLYDCVKALDHVINLSIPINSLKSKVSDNLTNTIKKCEIILNDTI